MGIMLLKCQSRRCLRRHMGSSNSLVQDWALSVDAPLHEIKKQLSDGVRDLLAIPQGSCEEPLGRTSVVHVSLIVNRLCC